LSGTVTAEDGDRLTIRQQDGRSTTVAKADIDERRTGISAMPDNIVEAMPDRDLRDLVAFLAMLEERRGMRFAIRRLHEKLPARNTLSHARSGEP
jgi:hypothetical protein